MQLRKRLLDKGSPSYGKSCTQVQWKTRKRMAYVGQLED